MNALETRPVNNVPDGNATEPFHFETHEGFNSFHALELPVDENKRPGTPWIPTGFVISGADDFLGDVLKERYFHNPAVGYTLRQRDGVVVEYQFQSPNLSSYPVGSYSRYPRRSRPN